MRLFFLLILFMFSFGVYADDEGEPHNHPHIVKEEGSYAPVEVSLDEETSANCVLYDIAAPVKTQVVGMEAVVMLPEGDDTGVLYKLFVPVRDTTYISKTEDRIKSLHAKLVTQGVCPE